MVSKFLGFPTSSALKGQGAFKFWKGILWGPLSYGASGFGCQDITWCKPCRRWDCPHITARDLLYMTGSSVFGRLWVSAGSRTFWVLRAARLHGTLGSAQRSGPDLSLAEETPTPHFKSATCSIKGLKFMASGFRDLWASVGSSVIDCIGSRCD